HPALGQVLGAGVPPGLHHAGDQGGDVGEQDDHGPAVHIHRFCGTPASAPGGYRRARAGRAAQLPVPRTDRVVSIRLPWLPSPVWEPVPNTVGPVAAAAAFSTPPIARAGSVSVTNALPFHRCTSGCGPL